MDPVAPLPLSPTPPSRVPLRSGGREDSPGAFWSQPEPPPQELSFKDLLAVINPLQHLPVVGSLYRELTGDVPHPAARVLGGALFGGAFGMFSAAINAIVEQATGKDLAQTAVALVRNGGVAEPAADLAQAPAPSAASAPATTPTTDEAGDEAGPAPAPAAVAEIEPQAAPVPPPFSPRRAAQAGARDLAYYQTMAGARLPPAGATTAPQNAGGHAPLLRPPLVVAAAVAPGAVAAPSTTAEHPFTESVRRGLDLYQQMKRQDAPGRTVDLVE